MPSEVAEVVDVLTRSGCLMYEIVTWTGWAAVNAARLIASLAQRFHERYGLNGQVRLKDLERLSAQGIPLTTGRIRQEDLDVLKEYASACAVPFAVTELPSQHALCVTFRQQDVPILSPVLKSLEAERLDGRAQEAALREGLPQDPLAFPDAALCAALVPAEEAESRDAANVLRRFGLHVTAGWESSLDVRALAPELGDCQVLLYPQPEEAAVRQALGELGIEASFPGAACRPVGEERLTFRSRSQRRTHAREESERELEMPAPEQEAAWHRGPTEAAPAADREPPESSLAQEQNPLQRSAAPAAGPERPALRKEAGTGPLQVSASPARAGRPEEQPLREGPRSLQAPPAEPALEQLRDWSSAGAQLAADDLSLFIRLAAANPELSAKNLFAAAGQGARGRLMPAAAWMRPGGALEAEGPIIWTGEPRRDPLGRLQRQAGPEGRRAQVLMDMTPLVPGGPVKGEGVPAPPRPEVIRAALAPRTFSRAGTPPEVLAARHALAEYRRRSLRRRGHPGGPPGMLQAEAALCTRIVLARLSLPVPEGMPELQGAEGLAEALRRSPPTFTSFERARAAADAICRDLEEKMHREERTFAPSHEER